jgi:hypothetical protein
MGIAVRFVMVTAWGNVAPKSEVLEAGQAADVVRSGCRTALQGAELVEVDRPFPLGLQVSVKEGGVADFVKGVAGDVLRAVGIEVREGSLIAVQLVRGYLNGWIIADTS